MKILICLSTSILALLVGCTPHSTSSNSSELKELFAEETSISTPQSTMQPDLIASPKPQTTYTQRPDYKSPTPSPESLPHDMDNEPAYAPSLEVDNAEPAHTSPVEVSPPSQGISMPVVESAPQPNLAATSPEVQEVLLQYTLEQIANISRQIESHTLCSANAVQNYYAGSLDFCKAFQVLTDAELRRSVAITNQYGNQLNNIQTEGYQRQSLQTDQDLYQDARRRSFDPSH